MMITTCRSCLARGGLIKNVVFLTGRIWEGTKRKEETIQPTGLPETLTLESSLAERCVYHQEGP